jgi:hypothetical protein
MSGTHQNIRLNREVVLLVVFITLIPLIQLGLSIYISFQMLSFLALLFLIDYRCVGKNLLLFIGMSLLMLISTLAYIDSPAFIHSFSRVIREIICIAVIISICASKKNEIRYYGAIKTTVTVFVVVMLVSLVLQYVAYNYFSSTAFFVPSNFYIAGFSTLADTWGNFAADKGIAIKIRPSSFYAEPSYLGFIALSMAAMVLKIFNDGQRKTILLLILFVSLLISQTLSGIIAFWILVSGYYFNDIRRIPVYVPVLILLLMPVYFIFFPLPEFVIRLLNVFNQTEELSGFIRLVLPFELISKVMAHSPLGVPQDELLAFLRQPAVGIEPEMLQRNATFGIQIAGLDNAFLNLFIFYGVTGFLLIWTFAMKIKDPLLLLYIALAALFSGSIFSFDKTVVISVVILVVAHCRKRSNLGVAREDDFADELEGNRLSKGLNA